MAFEEEVAKIQSQYTGKSKQSFKLTRILGGVGFASGIIFCVVKRKSTLGYMAYTFMFTLVGSTIGTAISMATDAPV